MAWVSPASSMDRALGRWATRKLAPYTAVSVPPVLAPAIPAGVALGGAARLLVAPGLVPLARYEATRERRSSTSVLD